MLLAGLLAGAMLLGGCDTEPGGTEAETAGEEDAEGLERPADMRTEEGLVEQLRTYFPEPEAKPEDWERGTGDWQPIDPPEGFRAGEAGYDSPGELMAAYASRTVGGEHGLGRDLWEATVRVLHRGEEDAASGALLEWGYADDSVVGADTRLELRSGDGGWYVEAGERRPHCRRGVTDDGRCT